MANMTDYERERALFILEVPDTFNFGFDVVDAWAEDPEKLVMLWVDEAGHSETYTFADIQRQSNRFANVLQGLGIGKGDGVMIVLPRLPQWHMMTVGIMKLGAIPIPGTALLTPERLRVPHQHGRGARSHRRRCRGSKSRGGAGTLSDVGTLYCAGRSPPGLARLRDCHGGSQ
jgi:acetyl-CoA synthetase